MTFETSAIYIGLSAILLVLLSANISRLRIKHRVSSGDGEVKALRRAMRAQGNTAEYMGVALLVVAASEAMGAPDLAVHALGGAFLAGRVMHCLPYLFDAPFLFRQLGTVLTWLMLLAGGAGLVGWSFFGSAAG